MNQNHASLAARGILFFLCAAAATVSIMFVRVVHADDLLFRYEGDVLPATDGQPGWLGDGCNRNCIEWVESGHFVRRWESQGENAGYGYDIAVAPEEPPPSLWAEWCFRSDKTDNPFHDAAFFIQFRQATETMYFSGDAVVSSSGDHGIGGLAAGTFHSFRFESPDGINYRFSVNGRVFRESYGNRQLTRHVILFQGFGGDLPLPTTNWWDFVRYGTIAYGEAIVATDPPAGYLDPTSCNALDRFTITFDSANYVYIDEVTVETTGTEPPVVLQTRRLDNGEPDTVEIVLDRPLPPGEHTRFIFDDGTIQNIIDYSFIPGDADGNGALDLREVATFQNCFGSSASNGACLAFDQDASGVIDANDIAPFSTSLNGPRE